MLFTPYFPVKTSVFDNFVYINIFYKPFLSYEDWVEVDCVYCSLQIGIDTKFNWCLCDFCQYDPLAQDYLNQVLQGYNRLTA